MNNNKLADEFQKYVGQTVKKVANILTEAIPQDIKKLCDDNGLTAFFAIQGRQNAPLPEGQPYVHVSLFEDETPSGQSTGNWRIARIEMM